MSSVGNSNTSVSQSTQSKELPRVTTTNVLNQVVHQILTEINRVYTVTIYLSAHRTNLASARSEEISATFIRDTGNIAINGTQSISNSTGTLSSAMVDIVANTSTNTIDIEVSCPSFTVNWDIGIKVKTSII